MQHHVVAFYLEFNFSNIILYPVYAIAILRYVATNCDGFGYAIRW